jgi:hypothetical protein
MTKPNREKECIVIQPSNRWTWKVCYKDIGIWANTLEDMAQFVAQLTLYKTKGIKTFQIGKGGWMRQ